MRPLYEMGFGWVEWLFRHFLLSAVVVCPDWLARLFTRRSDSNKG